MKIAILGTKGIPNNYGGFEQFAEIIGQTLTELGHEVIVYSAHFHPYMEHTYKGIKIVKKKNYSGSIGAVGNIYYDFLCLRDASKKADVILMCGYSSSFLYKYFPKKIIVNMDGLEWQRQKWNKWIKKYLLWSEKIAVRNANTIVVDNFKLIAYYKNKYSTKVNYIPYGATETKEDKADFVNVFNLTKKEYFLVISRLEPENNILVIIEAFIESKRKEKLVIVGGVNNKYGRNLLKNFASEKVIFINGIYETEKLNNLRINAKAYIHGHSVGGTNPSLLDAMAAKVPILAFDNIFNRYVLQQSTFFKNKNTLREILIQESYLNFEPELFAKRIKEEYSWAKITKEYLEIFSQM